MTSLLKAVPSGANPIFDALDNWRYGDDSSNQVVDWYVPRNGSSTCPLIVWIHGGGWVTGDESPGSMPTGVDALIRRGFAVVSIRYRLSSEAFWPAQIQDVLAAIREVRAHAPSFRVWPNKFAVWGASAGAHLAAMVATCSSDQLFFDGNWDDVLSSAAVGWCDAAPTHFSDWVSTPGFQSYDQPGGIVYGLFGGSVADNLEAAQKASPALRVTSSSAPLVVRHGTVDPVVPYAQAEALKNAYTAKGAPCSLVPMTGDGHGGPSWYNTTSITVIGNTFDRYLQP